MAIRLGHSAQLLQKSGHSTSMLMIKGAHLALDSKSRASPSPKSPPTPRVKGPGNKHHVKTEKIAKAERNEEVRKEEIKEHEIKGTEKSLPENFKPFKPEFKPKVTKPKGTCTIL